MLVCRLITQDKDVSSIPPYGQTTVYVRGSMNSWTPVNDWAMSFISNGVYSITKTLEQGEYGFKFSGPTWEQLDLGCNSVELADASIGLGSEGDCKLTVTESGNYTFTLNAIHELDNNVDKAVVSVTKN